MRRKHARTLQPGPTKVAVLLQVLQLLQFRKRPKKGSTQAQKRLVTGISRLAPCIPCRTRSCVQT
jgi:hypothetical protein